MSASDIWEISLDRDQVSYLAKTFFAYALDKEQMLGPPERAVTLPMFDYSLGQDLPDMRKPCERSHVITIDVHAACDGRVRRLIRIMDD